MSFYACLDLSGCYRWRPVVQDVRQYNLLFKIVTSCSLAIPTNAVIPTRKSYGTLAAISFVSKTRLTGCFITARIIGATVLKRERKKNQPYSQRGQNMTVANDH